MRGEGIVAEEPTVAAVKRSGSVVAVGRDASSADTDAFEIVRPIQHGTVADARVLEQFLTEILRPYKGRPFDRQHMVVTVPSASSPIERRLLRESVQSAGGDRIHVIENVLAAALGADLPLHEPLGTMIVDVGAGISEVALLSLGAVVAASSIRSGGLDVDAAIQTALRREYAMVVSNRVAEEIKLAASSIPLASANSGESGQEQPLIEARGRSVVEDEVITAILEANDVTPLLQEHWSAVVEAIRATLVQAPPELAQDLFSTGILLVGGGARPKALAEHIEKAFGLPVAVSAEPTHAVVLGAAKCLEAPTAFTNLFLGEHGLD